jgi:hypothetical protein
MFGGVLLETMINFKKGSTETHHAITKHHAYSLMAQDKKPKIHNGSPHSSIGHMLPQGLCFDV